MTNVIDERIQHLVRLDATNDEFLEQFEEGLASFAPVRNTEQAVQLMGLFRDEVSVDHAMWSLLHLVETLDSNNDYARALLTALPDLAVKSPGWASILVVRVLNSQPDLVTLIAEVGDADTQHKQALSMVLDGVIRDDPEFQSKAVSLLPLL